MHKTRAQTASSSIYNTNFKTDSFGGILDFNLYGIVIDKVELKLNKNSNIVWNGSGFYMTGNDLDTFYIINVNKLEGSYIDISIEFGVRSSEYLNMIGTYENITKIVYEGNCQIDELSDRIRILLKKNELANSIITKYIFLNVQNDKNIAFFEGNVVSIDFNDNVFLEIIINK